MNISDIRLLEMPWLNDNPGQLSACPAWFDSRNKNIYI